MIVLSVIFTFVAVFAGYKLYTIWRQYKTDQSIYSDLSDAYSQKREIATTPFEVAPGSDNISAAGGDEAEYVLNEVSPIVIPFDELQADVNPEIVGWLYCDNTKPQIDYPVCYKAGNDSFYLTHNAKLDGTAAGALFIGSANYPDFSDKNTVIHGHHLNDGSMLGNLGKWQDQEWFDEHKYAYLNTPTRNYKIEFVAYAVVAYNSDAYKVDFIDADDHAAWYDWVQEKNRVESDYEFKAGDRFVTLSTCMYEFDNARGVLIGHLLPLAG